MGVSTWAIYPHVDFTLKTMQWDNLQVLGEQFSPFLRLWDGTILLSCSWRPRLLLDFVKCQLILLCSLQHLEDVKLWAELPYQSSLDKHIQVSFSWPLMTNTDTHFQLQSELVAFCHFLPPHQITSDFNGASPGEAQVMTSGNIHFSIPCQCHTSIKEQLTITRHVYLNELRISVYTN